MIDILFKLLNVPMYAAKAAFWGGKKGLSLAEQAVESPKTLGAFGYEFGSEAAKNAVEFADKTLLYTLVDDWSVFKPVRDELIRVYLAKMLEKNNKELKKSLDRKITAIKMMDEIERLKKERLEMEKQ